MAIYNVFANDIDFGLVIADSAQEARDEIARQAGYDDEDEMERRLEQPSELVARLCDGRNWTAPR